MAAPVTAFQYLTQPAKYPSSPVVVLFGEDAFLVRQTGLTLSRQVLPGEDAEFSMTVFEKGDPAWMTVVREVSTVAMFGGGQRLVRIEQADSFVTRYREELENYLDHPSMTGVLVLCLKTFASNTTLYKKAAKSSFLIDCRIPAAKVVAPWLTAWAREQHGVSLPASSAVLLLDLVGDDMGLLTQEVARLSLLAGKDKKLTEELIAANVGSWRTKKVWDMLDAALDSHLPEALRQLDQLFSSKMEPVAVLAQIATTLRRFAAATRIFVEAEQKRIRIPLSSVLEQAGFNRYFIRKYEEQMKRLGRYRGDRILPLLVQTDLALKGDSRIDGRILIERLLVELAHPGTRNIPN